jgi:hypothetical protein
MFIHSSGEVPRAANDTQLARRETFEPLVIVLVVEVNRALVFK